MLEVIINIRDYEDVFFSDIEIHVKLDVAIIFYICVYVYLSYIGGDLIAKRYIFVDVGMNHTLIR